MQRREWLDITEDFTQRTALSWSEKRVIYALVHISPNIYRHRKCFHEYRDLLSQRMKPTPPSSPPPPLRFLPRHETVVSFMQYSTAGKQAFLRERGSSMPHQVLNTWSLITAWNVVIPLSFSRLRGNWFVWISWCTKLWKKVFLWGWGWILHQVFCDVVWF